MARPAKPDVWMPLYVNDYLGDTTHLTTEQHGAYLLLLMSAWKRQGRLPNDDMQLAAICRLTLQSWRKHRSVILPFFSGSGDDLIHKRVSEELGKASAMVEAARENGRRGGRPKSLKENPDETQTKPNPFIPVSKNPGFENPAETPARVMVKVDSSEITNYLSKPTQEVDISSQDSSQTAEVIPLGGRNGR